MDRFLSSAVNRIDAKGRVSVPGPFRALATKLGYSELYALRALDDPALDVGGKDMLERYERQLEQEATLKLRLAIDERGRVVAVDPVGHADPAFLAAARRHILKAWRYQPAKEGNKAIASSTVITLKFELD